MSYTTLTAIRIALENVVGGLTPTSPHFRRTSYRKGSYNVNWDQKAQTDLDREFEIPEISISEPTMFGTLDEVHYVGEFVLIICHAKTGDVRTGLDRRDTDLRQVISAFSKTSNLPTAVSYIWHNGLAIQELNDKFWLSTITFDIYFALAAP